MKEFGKPLSWLQQQLRTDCSIHAFLVFDKSVNTGIIIC